MEHQYMLVSTRPDGVTNTVYVSLTIARILEPHAITVDYEDTVTILTMPINDLRYAYNEE